MRIVTAVAFAALLSIALALTLPPDANMFVTDDDGVIVGVGRSHAGESFVLDLIASYQGVARLVIVSSGGEVVVHDVVVMQGTVLIEFVDLRDIATRSGFAEVVVEAIDVVDAARGVLPADAHGSERDAAPDVGQPGSARAPSRPTDPGQADRAPDDGPGAGRAPAIAVPEPPVRGPVDRPAGSPHTPGAPPVAAEPPGETGPPAATPGRPDGAPAHGPGGAREGGPPGPAEPQPAGEPGADDHPDDDRPGPPGQDRRP